MLNPREGEVLSILLPGGMSGKDRVRFLLTNPWNVLAGEAGRWLEVGGEVKVAGRRKRDTLQPVRAHHLSLRLRGWVWNLDTHFFFFFFLVTMFPMLWESSIFLTI